VSPAPWLVSAHGCYRCLPRFSHAPCSVSGADRRDPEAAAQRRRQREEERENALMLARRSLRARVRDMVLWVAAALLHSHSMGNLHARPPSQASLTAPVCLVSLVSRAWNRLLRALLRWSCACAGRRRRAPRLRSVASHVSRPSRRREHEGTVRAPVRHSSLCGTAFIDACSMARALTRLTPVPQLSRALQSQASAGDRSRGLAAVDGTRPS